ncbi:hypothetical protein ACLOJK_017888 [Asimina triloba]
MVVEDGGDLSGGADAGLPQERKMERKSAVGKTKTATIDRTGEKAVGGFVGEDDPRDFDFQNARSGGEDLQWVESLVSLEKRTCGPSISKTRA